MAKKKGENGNWVRSGYGNPWPSADVRQFTTEFDKFALQRCRDTPLNLWLALFHHSNRNYFA